MGEIAASLSTSVSAASVSAARFVPRTAPFRPYMRSSGRPPESEPRMGGATARRRAPIQGPSFPRSVG
jgi:hypothetical protein